MIALLVLLLPPLDVRVGRLSYYFPGDSCRTGRVMACDRPRRRRLYRRGSVHLAMRDVRRFGCGRPAVVCAERTRRCAVAPLLDAGPWGIGRRGIRRVWRSLRPPPRGWRFRALVDLSRELWRRLGRPPPLSRVWIAR